MNSDWKQLLKLAQLADHMIGLKATGWYDTVATNSTCIIADAQ